MLCAVFSAIPTMLMGMATQQRSVTFKALAAFIENSGGLVADQLSDGVDEQTGVRGLFVTGSLAAGEPLLVIPPGAYIEASDDDDDDDVPSGGTDPKGALKTFERLIVRLLAEWQGQSQLEPYLASLPTSVPLLRDWSDTELLALQDARLVAAAASQREHCDRTFRRVEERLATWYPGAEERRRAFDWAESIVRSRSLDVSDSGSGVRRMLLLPVFDLCNHHSRSALTTREGGDGGPQTAAEDGTPPSLVVTNDGGVVMLAGRDLSPGEEVTIEYHTAGGNAALLLNYGFAEYLELSQPGTEVLHVQLPWEPTTTAHLQRTCDDCTDAGIASVPTEPAMELALGSDEMDARALALLDSHLASLQAAAQAQEREVGREEQERLICALLLEAVEEALKERASTEAEDRATLTSIRSGLLADDSGRLAAALHFRIGQKRQLHRTAAALRALLSDLASPHQRVCQVNSSIGTWVREALRSVQGHV
jgi:hypothetical protein